MGGRDGLLDLPFDVYGRYRLVADVLGRLRAGSDPLRMLDVGGAAGVLSGFLPDDRVTVGDLPDDALAFEDGAFDYVVGVDPPGCAGPEAREKHLSELRRVARTGVLLTAYLDSDAARRAQRVMGEFLRVARPAGDRASDLGGIRGFFEGRGDAVSALPNGYLPHRMAMACLASYASELDGEPDGALGGLNAFYNEFLYGFDNAEPAHGHLLVCLREPADVRLEELLSPDPGPGRASQSEALFGALFATLPLAGELKRARIGRVEREGALARKEAQVGDLSRRLAERLTADEIQRNLLVNDLRQKLKELQRDHNQLRRNRDELQRQLTAVANSNAWRVVTALGTIKQKAQKLRGTG